MCEEIKLEPCPFCGGPLTILKAVGAGYALANHAMRRGRLAKRRRPRFCPQCGEKVVE